MPDRCEGEYGKGVFCRFFQKELLLIVYTSDDPRRSIAFERENNVIGSNRRGTPDTRDISHGRLPPNGRALAIYANVGRAHLQVHFDGSGTLERIVDRLLVLCGSTRPDLPQHACVSVIKCLLISVEYLSDRVCIVYWVSDRAKFGCALHYILREVSSIPVAACL